MTVPRPALVARLDAGTDGALTLITGPPGAGKTMLLSEWLAARASRGPVAWLSLEPADGRPIRFWHELLRLVQRAAGPGCPAFPDPAGGVDGEFVAAAAASAHALPSPVIVVLDDFEQLHSRATAESLDRFLRSPQRGLRLLIASRRDPGLSLQRLRLEGRLTELRSTDLALTREQAGRLFEMAGLWLTEDQVARLHARTEGWVGGLSLAALSLRGHPDPDAFVRIFTGDERTVADYLVEEVLTQQPRELREFMLRTSVVDVLTPDLAAALTGSGEAAGTLDRLERTNGFLMALDERRESYRYHPMFLELLRSQLRYRMPDAFLLAHRRAARWYAAEGMAEPAVPHAIAAGQAEMATELLSEHWLSLVVRGRARLLAGWVDGLPPAALAGNPELALAGAGAALAIADRDQAEGYLELADAHAGVVASKRRVHHALSRSLTAMMDARLRGDLAGARRSARKVLTAVQIASAPAQARALAQLTLAIADGWLGRSGERPGQFGGSPGQFGGSPGQFGGAPGQFGGAPEPSRGGREHSGGGGARLEQALELARRASGDYLVLDCLGQLALFGALEGALHDASGWALTAARIAAHHGWEGEPAAGAAFLGLAIVHLHRAQLQDAGEQLRRAARVLRSSQDRPLRCLTDVVRALLLARENPGEAARIASRARDDIEAWGLPQRLAAIAGATEAALLAAGGQPEAARRALSRGSLALAAPVESAVVLARLAFADSSPADAWRGLALALGGSGRALHPAAEVEALALGAVAKHLLHDDARALELLEQALERARPEDYRLALLNLGGPLPELLKRRIRAGTSHRALAGELLTALEHRGDDDTSSPALPLLEPLSDREVAVLRYLPAVMSKAEIAAELYLSVNTVKTHTKNIYRKLDVSTRTEAVRRARVLNLL